MAIDGHPWATDELDQLRADQRRRLRNLPDSLLGELSEYDPARVVANADDRLLLELTLRQHINEAGTLKALTESLDGAAGVYLVAALFEDAAFNSPLVRGRELFEPDSQSATLRRRDLRAKENDLDTVGDAAVLRYVHLLTLADRLADDGYVDPRLAGEQ